MDYLVTMTTHVPAGTAEATIGDIRAREAARARELAAQGSLLRLWRPPLEVGEWRTLGLFAADDPDRLESLLASMPLRVWRSDEVTPLGPHPNDPAVRGTVTTPAEGGQEFLTTFNVAAPEGTTEQTLDQTEAREAARARELTEEGHLLRLWTRPAEPGEWRTVGLWRARDAAEMQAIVESLPLFAWMAVETTPLTQHPNDPAAAGR